MAALTGAVRLALAMVDDGSPERVALELATRQHRTDDEQLNQRVREAVKAALGIR